MRVPGLVRALGITLGRSFFPVATLAVILGTLLWGSWVSLALTVVIYTVIKRLA